MFIERNSLVFIILSIIIIFWFFCFPDEAKGWVCIRNSTGNKGVQTTNQIARSIGIKNINHKIE